MNKEVQAPFQPMFQRILFGCLIGLLLGGPTGVVSLVAWSMLRDPLLFFFAGFGFLGVLYVPLIGAIVGCLLGWVVGGLLVVLRASLPRVE